MVETSEEEGSFRSRRAAIRFGLLGAATFLFCLSTTMLSLLAVILKQTGMAEHEIGVVLAASAVPLLFATLFSGTLIGRYGAIPVAIAGMAVVLVSYVGMQFVLQSFVGALLLRAGHGVGMGLFMPAVMVFAKDQLTGKRFMYYFGLFSSMMPLPNVLGPLIAETYLDRFGIDGFFLYTALPIVIALVIAVAMLDGAGAAHHATADSRYLKLFRLPALRLPSVAALTFGLIWGFAPAFMSLLLAGRGIPVFYFFSSYTVCMFGSRLIFLGVLQSVPRRLVVAGGLSGIALAYVVLALTSSPLAVVLAGILYGIAHSVNYPTLSVWMSEQFRPEDRARPVAMFNTLFNFGIFIAPLLGGYVISALGIPPFMLMLSAAGFVVAGYIAVLTLRPAAALPGA